MQINQCIKQQVEAKSIYIHLEVSDRFGAVLKDEKGNGIAETEETYVPDFFPGAHFGDYVILEIDLDTGVILNWPKNIKPEAIEEYFGIGRGEY